MKKIIYILSLALMSIAAANMTASAFPGSKPKKSAPADTPEQQMPANISHGMEKAKHIVAARVNGADITMYSVLKMMNRITSQKGRTVSQIKQEALDRLIFQELAFQKAQADRLNADKKEVANALAELKTRFKGPDEFKKYLEREMLTEKDLISEIERNLLLEMIFSKEVLEKVVIPEDELKKAYEQDKEEYKQKEKMLIADIVFFLDINDPASLKTAQETLNKLKEEQDNNPHKISSDGTFVVRDLEIKEDKDRDRERELYEIAKTLKRGDVSDVIRTSDSLHIIKLVEYTPEKQFSFEEVKDLINNKLRSQALQKRQQEWEAELKKDAKIEIVEIEQKTEEKK